ncbi:TPR repeat-containing protein [Toxoplasma gondii RUB]|uniref:TPR repeat-containing protein n=7 Tax=Toxoplasma gondii TaxID=5811 RepID=S7VYT3_TOXGG|nr:TPR repeat-containing protein [Toxoplasma gondii GT1]KAF4639986.1 TPR repeat-containing protein [Toxoplasma gondii]KFG52832.1 TPR repeat-containing protein [Toxoplasma gondii FOU]KFG62137.1 TPR repeat-containing protein [Toxoplasma gondii RUB]KFH16501.1 TPR repeat-containing protein [Toxoplasma gondii MAS]PUA86333.1 TPR repeat-containing protein [Toxoplasma gondii TgCATBr9]RQX69874.1 TPR repeat-containing protein [Toxoplasma gondii CAST]
MAMHENEAFWNDFLRRPAAQKAIQLEQRLMMREAAADLKHNHDKEKAELLELLGSCSSSSQELIQPMLGSSRVRWLLNTVRHRAATNGRLFHVELQSDATTLEKLKRLREEFELSPVSFSASEEQMHQVNSDAIKEIGPSDYSAPAQRTWRDIPQDELAERLCKGEICPRDEWIPGVSRDKRPLDPASLEDHLKLGDRMLQEGRAAYGAGDFNLASIRFTQGVQLLNWVKAARVEDQHLIDDMYLTHLRNQAQTALKLEKFQEAIKACTTIIQDIDEHDAKARYRRAKAYTMLGLVKCAKDDYVFILKSPYVDETAVKAARAALANLRRILNKYKLQTRETVQRSVAIDVFSGDRMCREREVADEGGFARPGHADDCAATGQWTEKSHVADKRWFVEQLKEKTSRLESGINIDKASPDGEAGDEGDVGPSRAPLKKSWFHRESRSEQSPTADSGETIPRKGDRREKHRNGNTANPLPLLPLEETKLLLEDLLDAYTDPETQAELENATRAADFDMRRFLIRVRKCLPEIQRPVFERHHLPGKNHRENLRIMEMSVSHWRSSDEAVDELRKECWNAIFGDLIDLDSA